MVFNKIKHTYNHNGEKYESVSHFINRYKKEFDSRLIAGRVAMSRNCGVDEVLEEWDFLKEISIDFGNAIDKTIDLFIKYGKKPKQTFLKKVVDEFEQLTKGMKLTSQVIFFSEINKLAGTTDVIISHGNKEISIWDIKSNGDIYKEPKQYFLEPLDSIPETKINTYRFQQTAYKRMAEEMGYKVREIALLHYTDKFNKIELKELSIDKIWKTN